MGDRLAQVVGGFIAGAFFGAILAVGIDLAIGGAALVLELLGSEVEVSSLGVANIGFFVVGCGILSAIGILDPVLQGIEDWWKARHRKDK